MSHAPRIAALALALVPLPRAARAARWEDATAATIGETAEWSNKVELADVDGDGLIDILFANGGNYSSPGDPELTRIFLNQGPELPFAEATEELLGETGALARVVKVRDVSGDGVPDLFLGTTYQTQSRLWLGDGKGGLTEVTATHLPDVDASIGDAELGDLDGDGDLDLVLADWGPGDPFEHDGAPIRVWTNGGDGHFAVATTDVPDKEIGFSWDLELLDVDGDFDLDVAVTCKLCTGSSLYTNAGDGALTDASSDLPQFGNNYDFEPIDLEGDGDLDLLTINDGDGLTEHVFRNDGGTFVDATEDLWPRAANVGNDDNALAVLDVDSDGDPDFLIGSLDGDDRLLLNDGDGDLTLEDEGVFDGAATTGTLGIQVADLNGDDVLDVVQSQGEAADPDKVYLGTGAPDTAAPTIVVEAGAAGIVRALVHDDKAPVMPHDLAEVTLEVEGDAFAMTWIGGGLWRVAALPDVPSYRVCATDAADNEACSPWQDVDGAPDAGDDDDVGDDVPLMGDDGGGCGCRAGGRDAGLGGLAALGLLAALGRRRRRVA